ncbi:MAG: aminotransferase class V-fold PLP-dependent enzyme [Myxococcales bacterium]|nr:aminotransferase class V-fold PLP-dependent enzyme [Myxococcales bacterium]
MRPILDPDGGAERLALALPEQGLDIDTVLDKLAQLLHATPSTSGRRFFNQLFAGRDPAATVADMLASLANNSMYTYKVAGPMVLVENLLVKEMGALAGFDDPEGVFTPGGSLSNLAALLCARNGAVPMARETGVDGRPLRVYSSAEAHYSIRKGLGMLGMGRDNLVSIACDTEGQMSPTALDAAIAADKAAGLTPVMINATAGTTVQGAFDPIDAIADVAEKHGVWLHVDGAFGGTLLLSERQRPKLAGLSRADSFTWDAHKMMGVPLICSVILVRQRGLLTRLLNESASYLFQGDTDLHNPGTRSLQCGRRNDVLKLWAAWQYHGRAGYAARVEHQLALANALADRVEAADDFTLTRRPASLNVCFVLNDKPADIICTQLNERGLAMVGHGTVDGQMIIRAAVVNPNLEEADLDELLRSIREVGDTL